MQINLTRIIHEYNFDNLNQISYLCKPFLKIKLSDCKKSLLVESYEKNICSFFNSDRAGSEN